LNKEDYLMLKWLRFKSRSLMHPSIVPPDHATALIDLPPPIEPDRDDPSAEGEIHADPVEKPSELAGQVASRLAPLISRQARHLAKSICQVMLQHQTRIEEQIHATAEQVAGVAIDRMSGAVHDLQVALVGRLDPLGDRVQAILEQGFADRWPGLADELNETCSIAARRSTLRPVIELLVAVVDRMHAERSFLAADYHREPQLAVDLNCRQLFERYDQALQSVVVELYMILRTLDVQPIHSSVGPLQPQHQRVREVEKTTNPNLDGIVARIEAPGFTWGDMVLRPEQVVVFKYQKEKSL